MGFWTKSVLIFKSLCENANQSIRQLARQTGMSKSSVHRLTQAIARRDRSRSRGYGKPKTVDGGSRVCWRQTSIPSVSSVA